MVKIRTIYVFSFISALLVLIISTCKVDTVGPAKATPYVFPELNQFPSHLNIPAENPTTVEGAELGRYLFYDGRLSGRNDQDSLMTCATCHIQSKGFVCGLDHPKFKGHPFGLPTAQYPNGKPTNHVMLSLVNTIYNSNGYLWDGAIEESNLTPGPEVKEFMGGSNLNYKSLESIVWLTITADNEIAGSIDKTVNMINSIPMYKPMFRKAFGTEEVNIDRISKAIAQFVRTIVAYRFKFYQYVLHKAELTPSELRGYTMFYNEKADCFHCHSGSLLMTTTEFYNNAKDTVFNDAYDRYLVTGKLVDRGAYCAPSLINCELTGPYMHDGRFKSLDEVIDFYSEGLVYSEFVSPLMTKVRFGGNHLTPDEKADLKAFLLTLTDHELINDLAYSCPEELGEFGIK